MSPPMRLALCPNCENWQPTLDSSSNIIRRCAQGIEAAPKVTVCNNFLLAPGRGGIQDWVPLAGQNEGQGQES